MRLSVVAFSVAQALLILPFLPPPGIVFFGPMRNNFAVTLPLSQISISFPSTGKQRWLCGKHAPWQQSVDSGKDFRIQREDRMCMEGSHKRWRSSVDKEMQNHRFLSSLGRTGKRRAHLPLLHDSTNVPSHGLCSVFESSLSCQTTQQWKADPCYHPVSYSGYENRFLSQNV